MPVPKPRAGENENDFVGRCMGSDTMQSEFPDQDQRAAVCYQAWRDKAALPVCTKAAAVELRTDDVNEEERSVKARISTDRTDSDLDVVLPQGLRWDRFRKNPVVLFMHDPFGLPIGTSMWQKVGKRDVLAKTRFANTEFADELFKMFAGGFLRAWSLGMDPMTVKRRDITQSDVRKRTDWAGARYIIEAAEVVEYSAVTIPANEDALNRAFTKGKFAHVRPIMEYRWSQLDKAGPISDTVTGGRRVRPVKVEPIRSVKVVRPTVGGVQAAIDREVRRVTGQL
jgi:hypothetical protein